MLQVYDIRMQKEMQTFQGHEKEVTSCAWHPVHEETFASGSCEIVAKHIVPTLTIMHGGHDIGSIGLQLRDSDEQPLKLAIRFLPLSHSASSPRCPARYLPFSCHVHTSQLHSYHSAFSKHSILNLTRGDDAAGMQMTAACLHGVYDTRMHKTGCWGRMRARSGRWHGMHWDMCLHQVGVSTYKLLYDTDVTCTLLSNQCGTMLWFWLARPLIRLCTLLLLGIALASFPAVHWHRSLVEVVPSLAQLTAPV